MRNFITNRPTRYADVPANLSSRRCRDKIDAILNDPDGYKVTDEYNHDDVRTLLRKHFGVKCVYCEASPIATSTFRIDHYRPKKHVKDTTHTGYYWLAYEWSNLMQTCQFCNGEKSNYFPLESTSIRVEDTTQYALSKTRRKPDTAPLSSELRLLLNPELDEVENHFFFTFDGDIHSASNEGQTSILRYGLKRPDLIASRKTIRDEHLDDIKEYLKEFEIAAKTNEGAAKALLFSNLKQKLMKFLNKYKIRAEFSLFHFHMFHKFEDFFVNHIAIDEHKDLLREAYTLFKAGGL